jgi:hypothetical protein
MTPRISAAFAVTWLYLTIAAHAQIVTGTILGTVTDPSKAILPGVAATITCLHFPAGRGQSRLTPAEHTGLEDWRRGHTR